MALFGIIAAATGGCADLWIFKIGDCQDKIENNIEDTKQFETITKIVRSQSQSTNQYVDISQSLRATLQNVKCGRLTITNTANVKIYAISEQIVNLTSQIQTELKAVTDVQIDNAVSKYNDLLATPAKGTNIKNTLKTHFHQVIDTSITSETIQETAQQVRLSQTLNADLKDIIVDEDCQIRQDALIDLFSESLMTVLDQAIVENKVIIDTIATMQNEIEEINSGVGDIAKKLLGSIWLWAAIAGIVLIIIVIIVLSKPKAAATIIGAARGGPAGAAAASLPN